MRELKFRAWVKRGLYPDNMYWFDITWGNFYDGNGWIGMLPVGETDKKNRIQVDSGDIELMQYTGLKDKKGKEIYEGDILKRTDDSLRLVKWSMFGFQLYSIKLPDRYWNSDYLDWQQSEVIGNIYENPELIKEIR